MSCIFNLLYPGVWFGLIEIERRLGFSCFEINSCQGGKYDAGLADRAQTRGLRELIIGWAVFPRGWILFDSASWTAMNLRSRLHIFPVPAWMRWEMLQLRNFILYPLTVLQRNIVVRFSEKYGNLLFTFSQFWDYHDSSLLGPGHNTRT